MAASRWREIANQVIAKVVADNPGLPEQELRKKLSEAYPFGQRQYHPYKIWLSAVKEHFQRKQPAPESIKFHWTKGSRDE